MIYGGETGARFFPRVPLFPVLGLEGLSLSASLTQPEPSRFRRTSGLRA